MRSSGRLGLAVSLACALLLSHVFVGCLSVAVPDAIVATWVTLDSLAADATDGVPAPRCDHTFTSLTGRTQRPNLAVPFANAATPTVDPYAQVIWVGGGHSDAQFNETWLLNVSSTVPVWRKLHNPGGEDGSVVPRWGFGAATIPNGLEGDDVGLTGLVFAGYNNDDGYLGDVLSINFASATQTEIVAGKLTSSDEQPFARGYVEWLALPGGAGTGGAINSSVDSGEFYTVNGIGPSTGVRSSDEDHDLRDEWIFSLVDGARAWRRLGQATCTRNVTICTDAMTLTAALTQYAAAVGTTLDFTSDLRPSEIYPAVQQLNETIVLANIQPLTDVDSACTTSCAEYGDDTTRLSPPIAEGSRMAILGGFLYLFGGYSCSVDGAQSQGGDSCYSNDMWIMNISTLAWTVVSQPDTTSDFYDYWPSKRAYHSMAAHKSKGLLFVEGGAYGDVSGSYYYYNDVFAFDVTLRLFVPLTTRGIPPLIHWSAGFQAEGDDLYLFGGCQGATTYNQLLVLKVGLSVEADNCYASGSGLLNATSDSLATFTIQARESSTYFSASLNSTQIAWGANASYGTGLTLTSQLVASKTPTGSLSLVQAKVVEIGNGEYTVTYTATAGRDFQLFVYYEDDQIPGSPFAMTLAPKPEASPTNTEAQGWGVELAAKGEVATTLVQVRDAYSNDFDDSSFLTSGATLNFTAAMGADADTLVSLPITVVNNNNGTYTITYDVPSSTADFLLVISLNGEQLSGSPYSVATLDPIKLPDALVNVLYFFTSLNVVICLICSIAVVLFRTEPSFRSSSPNFLHILIFGSILSSLSVIFLLQYEHDFGCQAFHSFLSIGLVMSMSALLAKSHRVARIFNAKQLKVQTNNSDSRLLVPTVAVILAMVLLNILWIAVNPMRSESVPSSNSANAAVLSFKTCSGQNGTAWLAVMLAFCCSVLIYGVYLAVKTGHVPEQFNESKVIAGSIYNIFVCSVIVVPLLFFIGTTSQFLVGRMVIQALVIIWCSLFTTVALIGPKLLILWRLKHVRAAGGGKTGSNGYQENATMILSQTGSSGSGASGAVATRTDASTRGSVMVRIEPHLGASSGSRGTPKPSPAIRPAPARGSLGVSPADRRHTGSVSQNFVVVDRRRHSLSQNGIVSLGPSAVNAVLASSVGNNRATLTSPISPSASSPLSATSDLSTNLARRNDDHTHLVHPHSPPHSLSPPPAATSPPPPQVYVHSNERHLRGAAPQSAVQLHLAPGMASSPSDSELTQSEPPQAWPVTAA